MSHRIPPLPFDVPSLIPEFVGLERETTLLYPRSGEPGVRSSSIGGPLLWPADEPWPVCGEPGHWRPSRTPTEVVGPDPVAMVPVVQLYARDVPELPFPAGTDVLQVLWCPLIHDSSGSVLPRLYWRSERTVAEGRTLTDPPVPYEYDEESVPRPCTVTPTRVVEYPAWDMPDGLSQTLDERLDRIEVEYGDTFFDLATTAMSKVGGYPGWQQPPDWPECRCGRRMDHLLSVTASEPWGRWCPLDEHEDEREDGGPDPDTTGHGMVLGDCGGVYLFVCTVCPDLPYAHRYDCC
ncbi:hypothetical protein ACWDR0_23405 [Streptomyces sp. NPDC003691]